MPPTNLTLTADHHSNTLSQVRQSTVPKGHFICCQRSNRSDQSLFHGFTDRLGTGGNIQLG